MNIIIRRCCCRLRRTRAGALARARAPLRGESVGDLGGLPGAVRYEELMAAGGEYRRLFMLQASGYQAGSDQQVPAR